MNGKDKYEAMLESATREKDPDKKIGWVITLLHMICVNDLSHIFSKVKKVDIKLNALLLLVAILIVFLFFTHPEVFSLVKAAR